MKLTDIRYSKYFLVREMFETGDIIKNFDSSVALPFVAGALNSRAMLLTGEGSSRIFPAKHAIYQAMKTGLPVSVLTEGSTQAMEYDLRDYAVFAASNSGRTGEVLRLVTRLKERGNSTLFGLTATSGSLLSQTVASTHLLSCGPENAVAATKSVVEQALFYDSLIRLMAGKPRPETGKLAPAFISVLEQESDRSVTEMMTKAGKIWFAGRNNGVAEELALKTNEITRKESGFLEGTFAVHGIEEVMNQGELLVWVDPFPHEEKKFRETLIEGAGINIIAIASEATTFPTLLIPDTTADSGFECYLQLAAGWRLLVEAAVALGVDPDKPVRARKIGNEYRPENG
jgi:glutamine---fructose-6-phosphate transaminase (isomerizing)